MTSIPSRHGIDGQRKHFKKSLTCNFQPVFVFYSFKCTEQCCTYQNSKSNTTTSTSVHSFDSPENSHRCTILKKSRKLSHLLLISILQNDVDTIWFIHKVIIHKGRNCIDYQYLLGLIPENSDSERREFIISSRSLLTSSDLGQLHNSMPHK